MYSRPTFLLSVLFRKEEKTVYPVYVSLHVSTCTGELVCGNFSLWMIFANVFCFASLHLSVSSLKAFNRCPDEMMMGE